MATTRAALRSIDDNLDESVGIRDERRVPELSPVASPRDIGRAPLRTFGRVTIELVEPDPEQPRIEFSEDAIQRLAKSIAEKGQLHPIRVRWSDERGKWLIISGERRWRATMAAGLSNIDCYFQNETLGASAILEQQLIENLLREDLKPMEQARGFAGLMELNGWTGKQVADSLHVAPSTVSRALALLDLPADIQERVNNGKLAARAAYEITKLPDASMQRSVANTKTPTTEKVRAAVKQKRGRTAEKKRGFKQTFFAESGIKVLVSSSKTVNYHEVETAIAEALEEVRHYIRNGRNAL